MKTKWFYTNTHMKTDIQAIACVRKRNTVRPKHTYTHTQTLAHYTSIYKLLQDRNRQNIQAIKVNVEDILNMKLQSSQAK